MICLNCSAIMAQQHTVLQNDPAIVQEWSQPQKGSKAASQITRDYWDHKVIQG